MTNTKFSIIGRYGHCDWAVACVEADLDWCKLSLDSPDLPKNGIVYQISEFNLVRPDGSSWRVDVRYNVICECIEAIKKSGRRFSFGAIKTLEELAGVK